MMEQASVDQTESKAIESHIRACLKQQRYAKADRYCRKLMQQFPDYAEGWHLASHVALKLNQPQRALRYVEKARSLCPAHQIYALHGIQCLMNVGEMKRAREYALLLKDAVFRHANLYHSLGTFYTRLKFYELALACYEKAILMQPDNLTYQYNKASLQRFLGDVEGAEISCEHILKSRPDDGEVILMRSGLRKQAQDSNHIDQLEKQLGEKNLDWRGQMQLGYALAKEYEDIQQYAQSFSVLQKAAGLRRRHMEYDVKRDIEVMEHVAEVFTAELFNENQSAKDGSQAIFIVGLPRSGTTLLERMLASHSSITSAGELNDFPVQLVSLCQEKLQGKAVERKRLVDVSATIDFAELGERYLRHANELIEPSLRFIDKLPLNFLYAGLIHLALPKATIVHMKRHPIDSCYAMYKQLFKDAYPFSYDLQDLGQYYLSYHRLMRHWQALMPGVMLEVDYESLVARPECVLRELFAHIGFEMEENCLAFHKLQSASTTASAAQVRQPLYHSSVAKWKHYAAPLAPLVEFLNTHGVDCSDC